MAEAPSSKRPRDEPPLPAASQADAGEAAAKRQKPYDEILSSLLDEEPEDETNHQDVSYLITSLQQELSSPASSAAEPPSPPPAEGGGPDDSDEREKVMKLLLEASDDELGLPSRSDSGGDSGAETGDVVAGMAAGLTDLCDGGLWELEDEAANYYAVMQSELFMM